LRGCLWEGTPSNSPAKPFNQMDHFANLEAPRGAACCGNKCNPPINALNFKFSAKPVEGFCVAFFKKRPLIQRACVGRAPQSAKFSLPFKAPRRGEFLPKAERGEPHKWGVPLIIERFCFLINPPPISKNLFTNPKKGDIINLRHN